MTPSLTSRHDPVAPSIPARPRIVIVGAGFAGLSAAVGLRHADAEITVIDRQNYHLFQPLLYQVATASLSPADIATPIRTILREQKNTSVIYGAVTGVDVAGKAVLMDKRRVSYDTLILATGARHAYFGHDDWEKSAPGLKKIEDAEHIRRRILLAFERAETETDDDERRRLLTIVVIGAGPTGVELAGAIAELAKRVLAREFQHTDLSATRVVLVEAGTRVLPTFPESLSEKAKHALTRLGVEVRLGEAVTRCDEAGVIAAGQRIEARTILWAAGVAASPAATWLGAESDRAGRVKVGADLTVPGHPEIFVLGDTASVQTEDGKTVPGVAPAAKQQGIYAARAIRARLDGLAVPPFHYRDFGNLATIGRKSAIADFGFMRVSGLFAWLLWGVAHIYFLIGFRNRATVLLDWLWAYLSAQRGSRLITGSGEDHHG